MAIVFWKGGNSAICLALLVVVLVSERYNCSTSVDIDFSSYHHYSDIDKLFHDLEKKFPNLAKVGSIGKSIQGRDLLYIQISDNVTITEPGEPMFKYVGNIHGNEAIGRELIVYLAQYLLENYNTDTRVKKLVDSTQIYLMPSANPDGFEQAKLGVSTGIFASDDSCTGILGRQNAQSVDLNRNFPDQFRKKPNDPIQTETKLLMKWITGNKFVLSANLHGGSVVASYPYDDSARHLLSGSIYSPAPDDAVFKKLALTFASNHKTMSAGNLCEGDNFANGITNGADWYDVPGGMQDYNYLHSNCFEITVELSCCKYPPVERLPIEWNNNKESLLAFMEQVHKGVKGFVREEGTDKGIANANVSVSGINHVVTTASYGDFWRLLVTGQYNITFSAEGYESQMVKDVEVKDDEPTELLVKLKRQNTDLSDLASSFANSTHRRPLSLTEPKVFKHHNHEEMTAFLKDISSQYPSITKLSSIGKSLQNRDLWVMEISDQPGVHEEGEPEFKYIANMHGNEVVGRETLLPFIQMLCENYGNNNFITQLIDETRIFIMPSMNPDGHEIAEEGDRQGVMGRTNANNVDLNRNFPDMYADRTSSAIQKETRFVMDWSKAHPFVLSANLHGGSLVANYPYDGIHNSKTPYAHHVYSKSPDDKVFKHLAEAFSWAHTQMHTGHPCDDMMPYEHFGDGITNGAHWYPLTGGMQDWNYFYTNDLELTIEQGCIKYPLEGNLKSYWDANKYAYLTYIVEAHKGVKGFVIDSDTGSGIRGAAISVAGINHTVVTAQAGDYWRILAPGTYQLTVSAHGYTSVSKRVVVGEGDAERVDFSLKSSVLETWSAKEDFDIAANIAAVDIAVGDISKSLEEIAATSDIATLSSVSNDKGNGIPKMITFSAGTEDLHKPHILLVGGLRSSESIGRNILIRLARHLAKGYEGHLKELLDKTVIHIVPQVSTQDSAADDCSGYTTAEQLSVDLNSTGVQALQQLMNQHPIRLALSVESGAELVRFPWDRQHKQFEGGIRQIQQSPDSELTFDMLSETYTSKHPTMSQGHDPCGHVFANGVTAGSNWIFNEKSFMDSVFSYHRTFMVSAHVTCCTKPNATDIPTIYMHNLQSILAFLDKSQQAVHGQVRDLSGNPIIGSTVKFDHEMEQFPTFGDGHFYRVITGGSHTVSALAKGYEELTQAVMVEEDQQVMKDFKLKHNIDYMPYHDSSDMNHLLLNITSQYPSIASVYSIGKSVEHRDIFGVRIAEEGESKPKVAVVAGIHGNEAVSTEVAIALISYLVRSQDIDTNIGQLLDTTEIHIIPLLNPDGASRSLPGCDVMDGQGNAVGIDLDNNFPGLFRSEPVREQQPETEVTMTWLREHQFDLLLNLRGGSDVVSYPYDAPPKSGAGTHTTPRTDILEFMAKSYIQEDEVETFIEKDTAQYKCYDSSQHNSTVNGALFRSHFGSMADYAFTSTGVLPLTIYTGCCFKPEAMQLAQVWNSHRSALIHTMQKVHVGIELVVRDDSGNPVSNAIVTLDSYQMIQKSDSNGVFYAMTMPGSYQVKVQAPGFEAVEKVILVAQLEHVVESVTVSQNQVLGMSKKTFIAGTVAAVVLLVLSTILLCCCCYKERASRLFKGNGFHPLRDYGDEADGAGYTFSSKTALLSDNYKDEETDSDFDVFDRPKRTSGKSYP